MTRFAEILKSRQISSVVWFHTDHWEPWGYGIDDRALDRVDAFVKQSCLSRFARKTTLFYLNDLIYASRGTSKSETAAVPGDCVEFRLRSPVAAARVREAIGAVSELTDVEFQVHIHHEFLTDNDSNWSDLHRSIKAHTYPALDEQRLRLLFQLSLDTIRHDTQSPMEKWAFIHGCWALNASDPAVCKVANEIQILMEYGCWGDFSFPAGRSRCDPSTVLQPYTVTPISAIKGYDLPEARPKPIDVGAHGIEPGRFLIWNSAAKADACSLDVYAPEDRARIGYRERIFDSWLRECPVIDGVLYIKTHAHSLNVGYYDDGATIPLVYPGVTALFDLLQRTCDEAQVELRLSTVDQVYRELNRLDGASGRQPTLVASASAGPRTRITKLENAALAKAISWTASSETARRGAGDYYLERFGRGRFFNEYDLYTAEYCARELRGFSPIVELGCGLGELSFLLGERGFDVIGIESDLLRHEGAATLLAELRAHDPQFDHVKFVSGTYPDILTGGALDMIRDGVLVCTHLTGTNLLENMDRVLHSLTRFEHLVIDVSTFGKRRDESSTKELVSRIVDAGFTEVGPVYRSSDTDLRHFQRRENPSVLVDRPTAILEPVSAGGDLLA